MFRCFGVKGLGVQVFRCLGVLGFRVWGPRFLRWDFDESGFGGKWILMKVVWMQVVFDESGC